MWTGASSPPRERIAREETSRTATLARLDAERDAYWARQPTAVSSLSSSFAMLPRSTSDAPPASSFDVAINTARLQRLLDTVLRTHPERAADIERYLNEIGAVTMQT